MTTPTEDSDLQLLLTDAEEMLPVLEGGLSPAALHELPTPGRAPRGKDSLELAAPDRDPNDLPAQRWAVVAPAGEDGDRMLDAIRALIDHRQAQQGAAPRLYRVDPGMDAAAAIRWRNDVLRDEDVPEDERPHYLLILGDLDRVSLELQHVLAGAALVGRLHCPTLKGYRAYAEKVVTRERAEPAPRGRALFYTVQDGTTAIQTGYTHLVEPCMTMTRSWVDDGKLDLGGVVEVPYSDWSPDEMLGQVGADEPSVLFSLSHGIGAPRKGWRTPDHQRALQGALSMGLEKPLSADTVQQTAFLPGGVWFCVACFAAGTPDASAFHPWLSLLADHGGDRQAARAVLQSLPTGDQRPFVAALPQTLLANPNGPLAVVGHMDLAWTFGFTDPLNKKSRASRMFSTLRALLAGSRVGVALDALMHVYRETNDDLTSRYQLQRDALSRNQPDPVDPRALGRLWMQRNDLRGYVLLGDPAARLPVASDQPALQDRRPPPGRAPTPVVALPAAPAQPPAREPEQPPAREPEPPLAAPAQPPAREPAPPIVAPAQPPAREPEPPPATPPRRVHEPEPHIPASGPPRPVAPHPSVPLAPHSEPDPPPSPLAPPAPPQVGGHSPPPARGAASFGQVERPRTLENLEIALRERAVLALLRGDEAPRSLAVRFGLPLEEMFYWLDVYREAGRKALGG